MAFVERVVRERLDGWFGGRRSIPQRGPVPGLDQWRHRFHGVGCCLDHVDGTELDVDFDDHGGGAPVLDVWFYDRWLETTRSPGLLESRLTMAGPWMATLEPLRDLGLLEGNHRVYVRSDAVRWCDVALEALELSEPDQARLAWFAWVIEDYPLAAELLGSDTTEAITIAAREQLGQESRGARPTDTE